MLCLAQLVLAIEPRDYPRAVLYRAGLVSGLVFGALPLLLWRLAGRPLRDFGPGGWLGDAERLAPLALLWVLLLLLAGRLALAGRLRGRVAGFYRRFDYLMPHTRRELRASWLASAAAGCGEEIAFRGFLLWYGAALLGFPAGLVASSLLFGAAHNYQGRPGMVFATLAGFLLGLVCLSGGGLALAMWMHATYNMSSFALGRALLAPAGGDRSGPL